MAAAALDGGHTTTSRRSERAAKHGIAFSCAATAMVRNRAMVVALEEEGLQQSGQWQATTTG
jgi:hypothetical protein